MGKAIISGSLGAVTNSTYGNIVGRRENATENSSRFYCSEAATFSYLQANISGGGSGTNTLTFRVNGVSQTLAASRSGSGFLSDTTNTVTVAAADTVTLLCANTGTNPTYALNSLVVSFSSGHGCFHGSADGTPQIYDVASSTRYVALNGGLEADGNATETDVQSKNRAYTSWESMAVNVTANARVNTSTLKNRINAADGTGSISIGAGVTGILTDTTIGDALASNDLLCMSLALGTGTEDLTISSFQATLKNSSLAKCDIVRREGGGTTRTASATATFYSYSGQTAGVTGSPYTFNTPYTLTFSNPRIYLSANTYTGNGTYSLRVDGTDRINVTLTAATTGWFEDTSSTYVSAAGVVFAGRIVNGTSGSITIREIAVTAQERYEITANTGSYAVTGSNADLKYGRKLIADTGSYAITGSAANLLYGRKFLSETGAYAITGFDANLLYGRKFSAESGAYAVTGNDANLLYGRNLLAETGAYSITGSDATLTVTAAGQYIINAEHGVYAVTGSNATLLATRSLLAASGAYAITGFDATLTKGGITPVVIEDTHDGDRVRKRFEKERRDRERRKKQIIEAYEYLIEGKVPAAQEIIEQFVESEEKAGTVAIEQQYINFDKFLNDLNAVERLWQLYLAMDDEDVLALL